MSDERNTTAPETVTVGKNNYATPLPVSPLGPFKSFIGLVFLGRRPIYFYFIFNTYDRVNLDFYILIVLQQTGRL